jgi:hypothetical protein
MSFSSFLCPFQSITVTQPNRKLTRRQQAPKSCTFAVENVFNALVNLEQNLPSAVHPIFPVSIYSKRKVTPCCDILVVTYRNREHVLHLFCAVHYNSQNMATKRPHHDALHTPSDLAFVTQINDS